MKIKNSISPRYSLSTSTRAGYFYHSYYGAIDKIFHTKDELEDYKFLVKGTIATFASLHPLSQS